MDTFTLADGHRMPRFGLGTWQMGESAGHLKSDVAAIRHALDIGYRLIDTAEMYGEGGAEKRVGEALAGAFAANLVSRADVTIVSKVYPHHATRKGMQKACEASLRRLAVDCIDIYLLHWRGSVPLAETLEGFVDLLQQKRIRSWGVSNFDCDDLSELAALVAKSEAPACVTNQIYYALSQRGPEYALLPQMRRERLALMAYSPLDQGALGRARQLAHIAREHGLSAAALALQFVMREPDVIAIPKASSPGHLEENLAAAQTPLAPQVLAELEKLYPAPHEKTPLAMI